MKLLKSIKNKRGAITPFMVIILALFVWLFILTYSHYLSSSQTLSEQRRLQVASDDLLAGFNEPLLKDYGLLAYESKDALNQVESSLNLNYKENRHAIFLKQNSDSQPIEGVDYDVLMTLDNRQSLADICVDIAVIQIPKVLVEEVASLYKWREKVEKKAHSYKKVDKVMQKMQDLQGHITDYHDTIKKVNDLGGFSASWYDSVDSARASYKLNALSDKHKKCLKSIKKLKKGLREAEELYIDAKKLKDPELDVLTKDLSFDMEDYSEYFSEEDSTDELIERLENNIELIEEIIDEENFEDVKDLDTDFWEKDPESENNSWMDFLNSMKDKAKDLKVDDSSFFGTTPKTLSAQDKVKLNILEHQLLNEYFLAVLKTKVPVSVRDFPILTRDERDSAFKQGEVEYLITGKKSSEFTIRMEIFGIRMGSNVIYLLSDRNKYKVAKTFGYTIGTWLPGGGTVGTILVITAWAGCEGIHDLSQLYAGKGVPFIKTDASWYLDIDLGKLAAVKNKNYKEGRNEQLDQYYNDYLRLLLILTPVDKKISRFQDVLLENMEASGVKNLELGQMVTKHRLQWQSHLVEGGYYEENTDK